MATVDVICKIFLTAMVIRSAWMISHDFKRFVDHKLKPQVATNNVFLSPEVLEALASFRRNKPRVKKEAVSVER